MEQNTIEEEITNALLYFYTETMNNLLMKYPNKSAVEIQKIIDKVIEESLEWDGWGY